MRMMVVVLAVVSVVGATAGEVVAQEDRAYILLRACEIEPDQNAAAQMLAGQFVDLVRAKFPGAVINAWTHVLAPFDQMHFLMVLPDLATYQSRTAALGADQDYMALVQKAQDGIFGDCRDELLRAVSPASPAQ